MPPHPHPACRKPKDPYRYSLQRLDPDARSEYSLDLRKKCHLEAETRVPYPTVCPRCNVPGTRFKIQMTYKDPCAGFWHCLVRFRLVDLTGVIADPCLL